MRAIIDIKKEQANDLESLCKIQKISRAEAIRRAISLYINENKIDYKDTAFGIWKNKKINSLEYQNNLREEW